MVSFVLNYNSEGPNLTGGLSKEPSHIPQPFPARRCLPEGGGYMGGSFTGGNQRFN